jgi:hypothetical protein
MSFVFTFFNGVKGKREVLSNVFDSEVIAREWFFNIDVDKIDFYDDIRLEKVEVQER